MIPEQRLSTAEQFAPLVTPNPQPSLVQSRQLGGVGLSDPSQGLDVKVWTCEVQGTAIIVYAHDVLPVTLFNRADVTEVSLAFDQNMRPFVAFVQAGVAKFYWYDSLIENYAFTDLPAGSTTPRATLDDHRSSQLNTSDIILTYIHDGNLYFRAQRDRYLIQYLLYGDLNLDLINPQIQWVSMQENFRLQFKIRGTFYGS